MNYMYKASINVDGIDVSHNAYHLVIKESMYYPILKGTLFFAVDGKELLLFETLYIGKPFDLKIEVFDRGSEMGKNTLVDTFELKCITINNISPVQPSLDAPTAQQNESSYNPMHKELFSLEFVDYNIYKALSKNITKSYFATKIEDVIKDILGDSISVEFDGNSSHKLDNQTEYAQILIPSLNITDSILYLNKLFGLYKGSLGFNFIYNKETDKIEARFININKKMSGEKDIEIYSLITGNPGYLADLAEKKNNLQNSKDKYLFLTVDSNYTPNQKTTQFLMNNMVNQKFVYYPDKKPFAISEIEIPGDFINKNDLVANDGAGGSLFDSKDFVDELPDRYNISHRYHIDEDTADNLFYGKYCDTIGKLALIKHTITGDYFTFDIHPGEVVNWNINEIDPDLDPIAGSYWISGIIREFTFDFNKLSASSMKTTLLTNRANLYSKINAEE